MSETINQKYLKDSSGNKITPIVFYESIYDSNGNSAKLQIETAVSNAQNAAINAQSYYNQMQNVTFTSGDSDDSDVTKNTGWTSIDKATSGNSLSTLLNKISTMMKNTRWINKLIGTTSISSIGDGTITGAISSLNAGNIIDIIYPVGSIYMTTSSENPAVTFGVGNWIPWGSGRVPVGVNMTDTSFDTVEEAGGVKAVDTYHRHKVDAHSHDITHTHTVPGSKHLHGTSSMSACIGSPTANANALGFVATTPAGGNSTYSVGNASTSQAPGHPGRSHNTAIAGTTDYATPAAVTTSAQSTTTSGESSPYTNYAGSNWLTNLQPYITCYMWKRVDYNYTIDLNDGQFVPSGYVMEGQTVYGSGANSYGITNAVSRCTITISGYTTFTIKVRNYADYRYNYLEVGNLDATNITRNGNNKYSTKNNSAAFYDYQEVTFTDIPAGTHTIEIIYSTYSTSFYGYGDNRGYFYIPEQ